MTTAMQTVEQYATARGVGVRQVRRYLADGRLPTAVKLDGTWSIPADAVPTPATGVLEVTSRDSTDVASRDQHVTSRVLPPGLWELGDVAAFYGTTVGRVRVMGEHPRSPFVVGPYGPPDDWGHATPRVWVFGS